MKGKLALLLVIVFCFSPASVLAQDATPSSSTPTATVQFDALRAYQDYLYTYNKYREAYNTFVTAKQAYLNYGTLNSKAEAKDKTLLMLQLRDETISTHLTALRTKLAEITGITDYDLNLIYLKLDDEVVWFTNHRESLTSAGTLEDLLLLSKKTENRYLKTTQINSYKTLYAIISHKEKNVYKKLNEHLLLLKDTLSRIRANGDKNTTVAERWLLEAENRLNRSQEKQQQADKLIATIETSNYNLSSTYTKAQFLLEESHQYLKEANLFTQEIIREVKNAD